MNFFNFSFNKSALPLVLNLSKNLEIYSLSSFLAAPKIFPFSLFIKFPLIDSPIASSYTFAIAAIAILNCLIKSCSISSVVTGFFGGFSFFMKNIGSGNSTSGKIGLTGWLNIILIRI